MTEQKICFTVDSNATSGLTVKSVQIDENVIDVSMNLDDNNANEIANTITNKHNAVTGAEALSPANVIVDANTQLPPVPVPVPESTVVNALSPPPVDEGKLLSNSNSKFSKYTLTSLLDRLKQNSINPSAETQTSLRKTIADELEKKIHNNTLSTSSSPDVILNALTELQNKYGELKMQKKGKVTNIILGGSHLTRKSPHNRRRRQSTIRKGHRSSRSKGKSKSRR